MLAPPRKPDDRPTATPLQLRREWVTVALMVSLLLLGLVASHVTERLDNIIYDSALAEAPRPTPDNIIIIAIDEESIGRIGQWPWPRSVHADILRQLAAAKPRAIVYDVLFTDQGASAADDMALGAAIAASGPVYLPMLFRVPGRDGRGYDVVPPIPMIAKGAHLGQAAINPDRDGVVRRIDLELVGARRWTHIISQALGAPANPLLKAPRAVLRRDKTVLVAFGGAPGHIRTVPFADVRDGRLPADFLRDKYILVGATAAGLGDQYATPLTGDVGVMSGIEIQANLLDALLAGAIVQPAAIVVQACFALLMAWLLLTAFLFLPPRRAAIAGVVLMGATLLASLVLLRLGHFWVPPGAALIGLIAVLPLWAWRRLAAVNDYMNAELERLADEPELFAAATAALPAGDDPVARQIALLSATITRMRRLRRLVSAAIHKLPDATVLVGLDGTIVMANAAATAVFGNDVTPADIDAGFAGEPPLPPFGPLAFAAPAEPWSTERTARDGSLREIRFVNWLDDDNTALGWIVRFADITALRRAEASREAALQLLTHDMRAPQASILALLTHTPSLPPADLQPRIAHYARQTIALADAFLHLARAEAGNYALAPVDLSDILIETVDDFWPQSCRLGIRIVTSGTEREVLVDGNRSLLARAIGNLLGNAIKYSPQGSTITCDIKLVGPDVVLNICDQGIGMDAEAVLRLFQRFNTNVQRQSGVRESVGLGLAFVHAVANGHAGTVACHSTLDVGTVFTITLPLGMPMPDDTPILQVG